MEQKFNKFSVPLGLLDYVNPILYSITMITIIKNTYSIMGKPYNLFLLIGAIISILFGLIIPTGKVIVGLGIIEFVMPVSLVFSVNTGILISGLMLLRYVTHMHAILLTLLLLLIIAALIKIYTKSKKINTIAVLTGAAGYLLIYTSLITLSIQKGMVLPIILYALAILLFVMLCGIGIKANLKNPKVHWVIEISNVLCQLLVAIATIVLFS
ncbi:MAG: hypothetical protein J6P61_09675 [Erysipelotrichaceae bacterium]|nr:hypothetical protein [Erysipelotrichaceae bacterium]